jgi:hypothetical protein
MSATKTQLIGGHFQDSEGNLLINGYLRLFLNQDEVVTGVGSICSGIFVQIQLDSAGNVASSTSTPAAPNQFIWSNDVMTPINSYYRVFGYAANGQLAWGGNNQQIVFGSGTFDLGTWIPNSVISWQPPIQPLTVEVNGTIAGSQTLLNLNAGSGVTLVDNGSGQVTITSTAIGATFDVNGTPTTSQTLINFESGTGITVSNPSAGNVLITNTSPGTTFSTVGQGGFFSSGIPMWGMYGVGTETTGNPSLGLGNNVVVVYQFVLESAWTLSSAAIQISTAFAGGSINFGFYSAGGAKLIDSGALSTALGNTPVRGTFTPVTLPPNTYYFACSASNSSTPTVFGLAFNYTTAYQNMLNANVAVARYGSAANPTVGGVMPANLGAIAPLGLATMPLVWWAV